VGIDLSRVASSALEAALDDGDERRKRSGLRTLAAGAALAVAARAAVSKAPGLVHMPDLSGLRDMPDRVRDRLADAGWIDDEQEVEDEEPEELEDEPQAQSDEDFDDDEEPEEEEEDEELEEEEDEPVDEAEADFDEPEEEDDEEDEEDEEEEPAPELEIESEDDEDLHPEDRPPKPPRSKAKSG
jgi:hypothetical protein